MHHNFGANIRIASVSELAQEGVIFVEDGNHGEYRPLKDEFVGRGVPFVRPPDLNDGQVDLVNCSKINNEAFARVRKGIGQGGDVILSHRATVGRVAMASPDAPIFVTNPGTTVWRSTDSAQLDQRYLYCFMRSPAFAEQLAAEVGNNCTFDYVSLSQQRNLLVPLPQIHEQRAIADILGSLDDKIELNRRMNQTLEQMARALFKSWFIDFDPVRYNQQRQADGQPAQGHDLHARFAHLFPASFQDSPLGSIPEGWTVQAIGDVCEFAYGRALKAADRRGGSVAVFGSNGIVDWHDIELVKGPGIVIGRKGNAGSVTWSSRNFWPIDTAFYVVPKVDTPILPYLRYALEYVGLPRLGADSAVPGLNRNAAHQSQIICPDAYCIDAFSEQFMAIDCKTAANENENKTLAEIRDALLPKLLSGEIRVPEAERIAAQAESEPEAAAEAVTAELSETATAPVPDVPAKQKRPAANQPFNEAALLGAVVKRIGSKKMPLGAFRRQKLCYLAHRKAGDDVTESHLKKAAGPLDVKARYQAESLARKKGYIQPIGEKEPPSFAPGANVAEADRYAGRRRDAAEWVAHHFKYETNDRLELLTTVDLAALELRRDGQAATAESVRQFIAAEPEWAPKLTEKAELFSEANIEQALAELAELFPDDGGGGGEQDGEAEADPATSEAEAGGDAAAVPVESDAEAPEAESEAAGGIQPTLFQADEAEGQATEPPRPDELTREEAMAAFRQACRGRGTMTREELLKATADRLGYQRLGKRIRETLKNHLRAAIRRRIVARDGPDYVSPDTRKIDDYDQEELIATIQSIMKPGVWWDHEELIEAVANHLGFARLRRTIRQPVENAIRNGVRQSVLYEDGRELCRS